MQIELKRIQTEVGITFVHVTHDQEEAMTMADTIAVMNAGVIEQMGPPAELYENPASTYVANFLGQSNLIRAEVTGRRGEELLVDVHGVTLSAPLSRARSREGAVWLGVRPEKVLLASAGTGDQDGYNTLPGGIVSDVSFVGVSTQYLVRMPWGQELMVFEQNAGTRPLITVGADVDVCWGAGHSILLDAAQDARAGVQSEAALAKTTAGVAG
jgi:spermidine/putrescine transport system ATP-binding protein